MKKPIIIVVLSFLLFGCTAKSMMSFEERDTAYAQYILSQNLTGEERVGGFRYRNWRPLSDRYLILETNYRKNYLIGIKKRCFGLRNSSGIQVNTSSALSLRVNQDSISTVEDIDTKCVIRSIFPITDTQVNELSSIGKVSEYQSKKES